MKKIYINLYPNQKTQDTLFSENVKRYFPIVLKILVSVILINILGFFLYQNLKIKEKKQNIYWQEMQPKVSSVLALQQEVAVLRDKYNQYRNIFIDLVSSSQILADLFQALPKNIWLSSLELNKEYIEFEGYVVEWKEGYSASIENLIKNLNNSQVFSRNFRTINPKKQRKAEFFSKEVVKFTIECKK